MMELQTVTAKRTRAQVMRDRVQVRLALDETGPQIAEVLKENGIELPGADWSRVFPHWLIAWDGDSVIGCLQMMPAKPVSWCQFLYARRSVSFKLRAIAIRKLIMQGMATAYHGGAQVVAGSLGTDNPAFLAVLKKLNFLSIGTDHLVVKRLR